jgi:hypothetical protein
MRHSIAFLLLLLVCYANSVSLLLRADEDDGFFSQPTRNDTVEWPLDPTQEVVWVWKNRYDRYTLYVQPGTGSRMVLDHCKSSAGQSTNPPFAKNVFSNVRTDRPSGSNDITHFNWTVTDFGLDIDPGGYYFQVSEGRGAISGPSFDSPVFHIRDPEETSASSRSTSTSISTTFSSPAGGPVSRPSVDSSSASRTPKKDVTSLALGIGIGLVVGIPLLFSWEYSSG